MSTCCRPSVHIHINTAKQIVHELPIKSHRSASQFVCSCRLLHTAVRLALPAVAICGRYDEATCDLQFSSPETAAVQSVFPCSASPLFQTYTHTHTKPAIPLSVVHTKHLLSAALHYPSQACYVSISTCLSPPFLGRPTFLFISLILKPHCII
jgi:hypothetical protein